VNLTSNIENQEHPSWKIFVTYSYPICVDVWCKTVKLQNPVKKGDLIYFQWHADDKLGNSTFVKAKENLKVTWGKNEKIRFFTDVIGDLASGSDSFFDKEISFTFKRKTKDEDNAVPTEDDMILGRITLNLLNYISTMKEDIYKNSPNVVMILDGDSTAKKKRMAKLSIKTKRGFTGQVFKDEECLDVGENSEEENDPIFQLQLELEEQKKLYRDIVAKNEKERQSFQKKN